MSAEFINALRSRFPQATDRASADHPAVNVPLEEVVAVLKFLRDEQAFDLLMDVTAIDWAEGAKPRFTVVYHLLSTSRAGSYIRVAAPCGGTDETPVAPSVTALWPGANWHERECYDMFGIRFEGHPDLRRILMWEQYKEGFPLRKDFPMRGRFSRSEQLKQALAANPEARYSMEELSIADAFEDLPSDMRHRLTGGEKTGE